MAGNPDGARRRAASFRSNVHTTKISNGKSFMRVRTPATPSPNSPSKPGTATATPVTPGTYRAAVAPSAATPHAVRAIPAKISESLRDPRKFPVALDSNLTTPSIYSPVSRLAPRTSPGTMSSRKLDGVHSLSAILEKQSQEPSLSQSKSKFARSTQSKAKSEKKFDPRAADSDEDDDDTSSSDDSDDDGPTDPSFFDRINGQVSSSKPASTPLKKSKRGKNDEVADSDVEHKALPSKPVITKKAPVKPESSSEESSGESEAEASESSDSESESDSESTKKPTLKAFAKAVPASDASTTSSSGSESESEVEVAKPVKPATKAAVNGTKVAKAASTSSSEASSSAEEESEDDKEEGEGSSSDEEASDNEAAEKSVAVTARRNNKDLSVPGFVGKDFVLRQAQGDEDGKDMSDFFAKAKLDGKQLWYFTAPSSIPINVVEKLQIPMDKAQNGDAIFKHNSEDYTVGFDVGSTTVQLLVPDKKGTRYEQVSQKVDKVLHVKRVTQLVGSAPPATRSNQTNAPRPQPPGLRARFHPIGVSDDTPLGKIGFDASSDSEEDVDMAPAPALASSSKRTKRTSAQPAASQDDAMEIDEPTPKSAKKDKKKPKSSAATPDQSKKASKRKVPADEEETPAQPAKSAVAAEKKAKKVKRDADSSALEAASQGSAKKVTAIPPPTIPKPGFSFSSLPAGSSPAPQTSTPQPKSKSKSSKKSKTDEAVIPGSSQTVSARKETPIHPPSARRESVVPIPQVPFKPSPAAEETPKKEKRKRRKSDKETPVPAPKV